MFQFGEVRFRPREKQDLELVPKWENSEFDEMVGTYGTNNVEIDGKYYQIQVYTGDSFFWGVLFSVSLVGWVAFGIVVARKGIR